MDYLPLVPPLLFGLALARGKVHESSIVIGQMTFSHFVMLKMFLSALGTSALVTAYHYKTKCIDDNEREKFYQRSNRGLHAVILGCALVGLGMTLSGSCPGTVYAQLGALSWLAIPIMIGGICGAFVFEQFLNSKLQTFFTEGFLPQEQNALYKIINSKFNLQLRSEEFLTYFGASFLGLVFVLELIVNWKTDLAGLYPDTYQDLNIITAQPAIISGLMIGAAQYISLTYLNKQLGCSLTFVEILQIIYSKCIKPQADKLNNQQCNELCSATCDSISKPSCEPYPITAYGITLGALIGTITSMSLYVGRAATDFPPIGAVGSGFIGVLLLIIRVFLGGFIAVLGARIAGGCTSGIGLSYTSTGSTTGFIGMATMFGSAILLGIIFKLL